MAISDNVVSSFLYRSKLNIFKNIINSYLFFILLFALTIRKKFILLANHNVYLTWCLHKR